MPGGGDQEPAGSHHHLMPLCEPDGTYWGADGRARAHRRVNRSHSALLNAIGQLTIHYPLVFHAESWRTLTAELAQREIGLAPARPIMLARRHYDALPFDVKV